MNSSMIPSDVIIIGAGLSGICAGIQLQSTFKNATFEIFEKSNDIGGTWSKNTYPNLSCDIPSHLYAYSFALNPDWSTTYASQIEILAYIKRVAYNLQSRIHLGQECVSAEWHEETALWKVQFIDRTTNETYVRHSRTLFTAVGFLDAPKGLEGVTGNHEFRGRIFHSSNWDDEVNFEGKDVVVVGNGASANQFVPWLLKSTGLRNLVQVVRSAQWIAPKNNQRIGNMQKWVFNSFPFTNRLYCWWLAIKLDLAFVAFKNNFLGRHVRSVLEASLVSYIEQTAPSQYRPILVPSYAFGAKRAILDHEYLASLHNPKAKLVKSNSLTVVGARQIADENGVIYPADIIILANGFKTAQLLTPMTIIGLNGVKLRDLWERGPNGARAYMGVMVSEFPNLFLLTGPNTLPSGHSTLLGIEHSVTYILRLLKPLLGSKVQSNQPRTSKINVKKRAENDFNKFVENRMKKLVYTSDISTWYIDQRTGRNHLIWPGSQLEFWWSRCIKRIRWSDFVLSKDKTT